MFCRCTIAIEPRVLKMASELVPVRDYMEDESIQWRTIKPNYKLVNDKYMKEKTNNHAAVLSRSWLKIL